MKWIISFRNTGRCTNRYALEAEYNFQLRILHIIPAYKPAAHYGGPTISVADLCEALADSSTDQVTVYATNANGPKNLDIQLGVPLVINQVRVFYHRRWTKDQTNFSPGLLIRLWRTARSFDVIHLHAWWNLVSIPSVLICIIKGIRPVLSARGTFSRFSFQHRNAGLKRVFHRWIGQRLLSQCHLHLTSEKEVSELSRILPKFDSTIISNILSLHDRIPNVRPESDVFRMIFLGRIDPVKNLETIIDSCSDDFNFTWRLDIFGTGDELYLNALKESVSPGTPIHFKGAIHDDLKWDELYHSDLLILPSFTENFGNVVVEALSQGTPVLVSDQVGLSHFVRENDLGWVNKSGSTNWSDVIQLIYQDRSKRHRIRESAPGIILNKFGKQNLIREYHKMYSELARSEKSSFSRQASHMES